MDTFYAEKQLIDALPKMRDAADHPDLQQAFAKHLAETENQVMRIERVFESIGVKADVKKCAAILGILSEAKELMAHNDSPAQRDAALICAAQKVEHYEIANYGCLRAYAETLGLETAASLLSQTLEEEIAADETLSDLAERGINEAAAGLSVDVTTPKRQTSGTR
jgi:ferritin-like metal-binding protein YciE